jgi:hypothetical protein
MKISNKYKNSYFFNKTQEIEQIKNFNANHNNTHLATKS